MASKGADTVDLLGDPVPSWECDLYAAPRAEPGKVVDLSGSATSLGQSRPPSGGVLGGQSSLSSFGSGAGSASVPVSSPASIEGGSSGVELSLNGLNPGNIMRELATRPVTELVREHGRHLLDMPRYVMRAYTAASKRYLRPWKEFVRLRPSQTIDGFRRASQRGELQIHLQRNVLANAKAFCPNYAFLFLATLFTLVASSPFLLCMLGLTGGGWSHALRSDNFRSRPWTLQIGGVYVPLGSNIKMALMTLPTLLMLHFFMGPVLWSAAFYSGGVSLAHAALRDRDHDDDREQDLGPSTVQIQELP